MIFIGLDMSLNAAGICIMRDDGAPMLRTFRADGKNNKLRRDSQINRVLEMIWSERAAPEMICIEQAVMHTTHANGADQTFTLSVCMADELVAAGLPVQKVPPSTLKKYWSGLGRADKPAMIAAAKRRGYSPADDNQADALANAVLARDIIRWRSGRVDGCAKLEAEILVRYAGAGSTGRK